MSTRSLILPLEIPKKRKKKYTFAMEKTNFPFSCVWILHVRLLIKSLKMLNQNLRFLGKALSEIIQCSNRVIKWNHNKQKQEENSARWNLMRCSISEPKNDLYKHWTTSPTKAITLTLLFFIQETEPLSSHYPGVIKCWYKLQFRLLEVTLCSFPKYCLEITWWVLLIIWSYWTLSALKWWFMKKETF